MANVFINSHFNGDYAQQTEIDLVEDIAAESIEVQGVQAAYIRKSVKAIDDILVEISVESYRDLYWVPVYIESAPNDDGASDLITKFGLTFDDNYNFVISRKHFNMLGIPGLNAPEEGDLLWLPLTRTIYVISDAPHRHDFAQLGKKVTWLLICKPYTTAFADIETGETEIDINYNPTAIINELLATNDNLTIGGVGDAIVNEDDGPFGGF